MSTNSNILAGLLAVKDLMIANLTDRIEILKEKIRYLQRENEDLYIYINSLDAPKEETSETKVGFHQKEKK